MEKGTMSNDEFVKFLADKIEKFDDKQDHLVEKMTSNHIEVTRRLDRYNDELERHIARNDNFEKDLNVFRDAVSPIVDQYKKELTIRESRQKALIRFTKITTAIGAVLGMIYGIIKIVAVI